MSGPVRDRIDLAVDVPPVPFDDWAGTGSSEHTADVRRRVEAARAHQVARQGVLNARLRGEAIRQIGQQRDVRPLLARAIGTFGLSARGVDRILKVSRTIADLDGHDRVARDHVAEALQFRMAAPSGCRVTALSRRRRRDVLDTAHNWCYIPRRILPDGRLRRCGAAFLMRSCHAPPVRAVPDALPRPWRVAGRCAV